MLAGITKDFPALCTVLEETRHNLETGDVVVLSEVGGMPELNGREFVVTVKDPYSFEIMQDTRELGDYQTGGYVNQVKQSTTVSFKKFSDSINNPGNFDGDYMKADRAAPLHAAFRCD